MNRKKIVIWMIIVVVFLDMLYLLGRAVLPSVHLEFRWWVDILGLLLLLWVLPFLLLFSVLRRFLQKGTHSVAGRVAAGIVTVLAAGLFVIWSYLAILGLLFTTQEEHRMLPGLLAVNKGGFLEESRYFYYEPVGFLFRRETEITPDTRLKWLSDKYGRKFRLIESGKTCLFQDEAHPEVQVRVSISGVKITDDYIEGLTQYYLQMGYEELGLSREVWTDGLRENSYGQPYDTWRLVLEDAADLEAFCRDAAALMDYVANADNIFEDYRTNLQFSMKALGRKNTFNIACLPFGKLGQWDEAEAFYYLDGAALQDIVQAKCDCMIEWVEESEQWELKAEEMAEAEKEEAASVSEPVLTESEQAEGAWPEQAKAAKAVYEEILEELGYQYEAKCNAKGNFYVDLGRHPADNLQNKEEESRYYLTYDRESKNGNCYLFVLSEEPIAEETGAYSDAKLREFYAVEKATGKVVAGNKTGWGQPGCAEYRELTGE